MTFYVVWLWGCNKNIPKPILMGTDLEYIKTELEIKAGVKDFKQMIDWDEMKNFDLNEEEIVNGDIGQIDDCQDYYILKKPFEKLAKIYYPEYSGCSCMYRLTIFYMCLDKVMSVTDMEKAIYENQT